MKRRPLSRAAPPAAGSARASAFKAAAAFGAPIASTPDMSRAVSLPNSKASRHKHPQLQDQNQHSNQQEPQRRSQDDEEDSGRPAENGTSSAKAGERDWALQIASGQAESQSLPYQSLRKVSSDVRDPVGSMQSATSPFGRPARRPSASRLSRGGSVQSSSSIMSPAAISSRGPSASLTLHEMGSAPLAPTINASSLRSPFAFNTLSGDSSGATPGRNFSTPVSSDVPLTMQSLQSHNAQADIFSPMDPSNLAEPLLVPPIATCSSLPVPPVQPSIPETHVPGFPGPMDPSNAPEQLPLDPTATSSSLPIPPLQPSITRMPLPDFPPRGFSLARPSRLSTMSSDADTDFGPNAMASGELTVDEIINRVRMEYQREAALQQIVPFPAPPPSSSPPPPLFQGPSDPISASSIADDPNQITASWLSSFSITPTSTGPPSRQWRLPLGLFPSSMSEAAEILPPEGGTMAIHQYSLISASLPWSASSEGGDDLEEDRARNKDPRSLDSSFGPFAPTLPFTTRLRSVTESCDSRAGSFMTSEPRQKNGPRLMSGVPRSREPPQEPTNGHSNLPPQPQSSTTDRPHQLKSPFAMSPSRDPSLKGNQAFSEAAHAGSSMPDSQQHISQDLSGDDSQSQPRGLQRQLGQTFPQRANSTSTFASSSNFPDISPQDIPRAKQRPEEFFHSIHTLPAVRAGSIIRESEEGGLESTRSSGTGAAGSSFSELVQEIAVMKKLAHPNIVKLLEVSASRPASSTARTAAPNSVSCVFSSVPPCEVWSEQIQAG